MATSRSLADPPPETDILQELHRYYLTRALEAVDEYLDGSTSAEAAFAEFRDMLHEAYNYPFPVPVPKECKYNYDYEYALFTLLVLILV